MNAPFRTLTLALLFAATIFFTDACSSTKSADQTADPGASASATIGTAGANGPDATNEAEATTAATADNGDANSNGDDPCQKLELSDVQPFFSATLSLKKDDNLIGSAAGCRFRTPDDHTNFEVITVVGPQAARYYDGTLSQVGGGAAKAVPGIGDKAVRSPDNVSVHALKGNVFCMLDADIHARGSLKGFESYADKPIPDALAGPEAAKLATICTKLFD